MKIIKKVPLVLVLILVAVLSFTKITPVAASVDAHQAVIAQIDAEITNVLKLTAGAAGASAVISLLPGDDLTPIANELAELSKYFLVILSALYLEKYLVTVFGFVSFSVLIPVACALVGIGILTKRNAVTTFAVKLVACAATLFILIPTSTKVSGMIYDTYGNSIESTIAESDRITVADNSEDKGLVEKFTSWISQATISVSNYVTKLLSQFIDALAVMIVTSCIIPLLVVIFFLWILKILFNIQIPLENLRIDKLFKGEKKASTK